MSERPTIPRDEIALRALGATLQAEAERAQAHGERLLKIAQVAIMANVSERTIWADIAAGRLDVQRQKLKHRHRNRVRLSEAKRYALGRKPVHNCT